ncbi:MAG: HAD-IIB family hydrolase [Micropruina sp.]
MGKTVFIDFDGTFADHGVAPRRHVEAVREAQARGHRMLLCTGRARCMVTPDLLELFDGLVGSAGAYVEVAGRVLADHRFPPELAERTIALLDANDVGYVLEAPGGLYGPADAAERARRALTVTAAGDDSSGEETVARHIEEALQLDGAANEQLFAKVACFDAAVPLREVAAQLAPEVGFVPSSLAILGDRAGEFHLASITKAAGIAAVEEHFGIEHSDTVAIGDGFNDLEMLDYAGTAVAIEGSPEPVLRRADLVVPPPARHGIVAAFAALGLIAQPALQH